MKIGPLIWRTVTSVPSGTICPDWLRTCSRLMSGTSSRNRPSACSVTCQCRPNSLKLLTYSEPRAVLDDELEAAGAAQARDGRGAEDDRHPVLELPVPRPPQPRHHGRVLQVGPLPLGERLEDDEQRAEVGAVGLLHERQAADG